MPVDKDFGSINNGSDTYLIRIAHCCNVQLKPFLDVMGPEMMWPIIQALYKSTLDEACVSRQTVDAVAGSESLL